MKGNWFFAVGIFVLLLGSPFARAQRGRFAGPSYNGRHIPAGGRPIPARIARGGVVSSNRLASVSPYPGTGLGINGINTIMAPSNLGVEAAIDPATQWNLALTERLLRNSGGNFQGGGYYLLSGGGAYVLPAELAEVAEPAQPARQPENAPAPQIIVLQQAPAQPAAVPPAQETASPAPADIGQFTLVLRSGKQIQTVAFSHTSGRIIYITGDGSRRTIPLADVDADATIQVNQERGTPLQLPL
jgi:hypothetical protein